MQSTDGVKVSQGSHGAEASSAVVPGDPMISGDPMNDCTLPQTRVYDRCTSLDIPLRTRMDSLSANRNPLCIYIDA